MSPDEYTLYTKLSAAGKKQYSADRAKEEDATNGHYASTLKKLQTGYYNKL